MFCTNEIDDEKKLLNNEQCQTCSETLKYVCEKGGDITLFKLALLKNAVPLNELNILLTISTNYNNMDIAKFLIEKGANEWDSCLIYGCMHGNIEIMNIGIKNGSTKFNEAAMWGTVQSQVETVTKMINCGANNYENCLYHACRESCIPLIKLMIEKGAQDRSMLMQCQIDKLKELGLNLNEFDN